MIAADPNAEDALRLAVSERPDQMRHRAALAEFLSQTERRPEALGILRQGLLFAGEREDRLEELAEAFVAMDSWPDAIEVLQSASRLAPQEGRIPARLAWLWARLGDSEKASGWAKRAEALGVVTVLDIGIGQSEAMTRQLFNQYADSFDEHLLGKLHYAVPAELERMLAPYSDRFAALAIDLGCGTGLMGERLRAKTARLVGVDLSPGMLDQARGKAIYDELIQDDGVAYLQNNTVAAGLIVAADVLVYIGDIAPLFHAAFSCLAAAGLFAFTVESLGEGGFVLGATKRFSHSRAYLFRTAQAAGFRILACESIVPRMDSGEPVDGLALLLEKSGAY